MTTFKNGTRKPGAAQDDSRKENTIIRTPRTAERPYFSTARSTAQDTSLSYEARGVLWYLLSKPDDWVVQWKDIAAQGKIGRDKAKSILKELRDAGYIITEIAKGDDGKFSGKTERIYETSQGSRSTENPSHGKSVQREIRHIHITEQVQSTEVIAPAAQATPKPRPRNLHFDAIVEAFKFDPRHLTRTESSGIAKVANELKTAGYTPEDIAGIYAYCKAQKFDSFTPAALTKHAGAWRAKVTPHIDADGKRTDSPSGLHIFKVVG